MKQQFKKCITLITIVMMIITMMPRLAHAEDSDTTTVVETEQIETINDQSEIVEETDKEEVVEEVLEEIPVETEVVQEEPKENNEPVKINPEPKNEEVKAPKYCVEGGTIHLEGDGAGEHGYYNSWDEAFNTMNSYTAGWETFNYKIGACPCGKYYFKVTK